MKPASRFRVLALLLCLAWAAQAHARVLTIDRHNRTITARMTALEPHVVGRVKQEPLGPRILSWVHQWPGIYFEAAFAGTAFTLKFDDPTNEYRLTIDSAKPVTIPPPGKVEMTFSRLSPGRHRLRLEKVTESGSSSGAFQGFFISRNDRALPVAPRRLQMEFIGDSTITGYANRLHKRQCTPEEVKAATDTQSAFPVLVAKHYGADYQVNAVSARGVVRNFAGIMPEFTLPKLYPFTLLDKTIPYLNPHWQPTIVFIKLNADFVGDLSPSEQWQDFDQVARDYGPAFGSFVGDVHRRSPGAAFVLWWFDTSGIEATGTAELLRQVQRQIVEVAGKAGATKVHFMPVSQAGLRRDSCDGHYSIEDHLVLAERVISFLDRNVTSPGPRH